MVSVRSNKWLAKELKALVEMIDEGPHCDQAISALSVLAEYIESGDLVIHDRNNGDGACCDNGCGKTCMYKEGEKALEED